MPDDDPGTPRRRHKTDPPPLTAREVRFCALFVDKGNAYQCYLDAGFPPKANRQATDQAAKRTVRKRQIREYIRHLQHVAAEAAKVTVEELAAIVANWVKADRRKLWAKGRMLHPDEWPDDVAACVDSFEVEETLEPVPGAKGSRRVKSRVKKAKMVSKMAAAQKLMEWKRMVPGTAANDQSKAGHAPLVVGGEADPNAL